MMWHTHKWSEQSRHIIPPCQNRLEITRTSTELAEQIIFGVTVVVLKCATCGDVKERRILGAAVGHGYISSSVPEA